MNTLTMSLLNATWFAGYGLFQRLSSFTDTSLALQLVNSEAGINFAHECGIGIVIIFCSIAILGVIQRLISFITVPPPAQGPCPLQPCAPPHATPRPLAAELSPSLPSPRDCDPRTPPTTPPAHATKTILSDLESVILQKLSDVEYTTARGLIRTLKNDLPMLELKEVNSALYKMLNRNLVIMRKEGVKPIWRVAL